MSYVVSLYAAIIFFVLTPGVILSLPPGGNVYTVAAVHAVVFFIIIMLTHKLVWTHLAKPLEGEHHS